MELKISSYSFIKKGKIQSTSLSDFEPEEANCFASFAKQAYRNYKIKYPKFFKMDPLSKLGFLASEILLDGRKLNEIYPAERIGVVLQNSHSTYDMDKKYHNTIKDKENYFPSPAVFVYTLPNVMIGEICIRNKFQGENTCFINGSPDWEFLNFYIRNLFEEEKVDACITGWVDAFKDDYSAYLFLIEKNEEIKQDNISFNVSNIGRLLDSN